MGNHNHTRKGRAATKGRREVALNTLSKVKEPNKRQLSEIEVLEQRISRRG